MRAAVVGVPVGEIASGPLAAAAVEAVGAVEAAAVVAVVQEGGKPSGELVT